MKKKRLHLGLFQLFSDLAETRSFTRAAALNDLTQSAVSQQLSFLERSIGKILIDRNRGRLALTAAGRAFGAASRDILSTYQDLLDRLQERAGEASGIVKLETVESVGLYRLAPLLEDFKRLHPLIEVRVAYLPSPRIYSDLLAGECSLAVLPYGAAHPALSLRPLAAEALVLVCAPSHPLARQRALSPRDLHRRRFIALPAGLPARQAIDRFLRRDRTLVDIRHEFASIETIKRAVEIGAGVSILPEAAVSRERKNGALACVPFADAGFARPVSLLTSSRRNLSRAAFNLVRFLEKSPRSAPAPFAAGRA